MPFVKVYEEFIGTYINFKSQITFIIHNNI